MGNIELTGRTQAHSWHVNYLFAKGFSNFTKSDDTDLQFKPTSIIKPQNCSFQTHKKSVPFKYKM